MRDKLYISPRRNVVYSHNGKTYSGVKYEDLGTLVKPGFYARVWDANHATFFVRWVDNPGSFADTAFDPNHTIEVSVSNGPPVRVRGHWFLAVGGNQGYRVTPLWLLVVSPTIGWPRQGIFDNMAPFSNFKPQPAIIWYEGIHSASGDGPNHYLDGFGDPRFRR